MNLMIRFVLAAGLCASLPSAGWSQRVMFAPNGDELLMPKPEDQTCFDNWIEIVASDPAPEVREIVLDCNPPDLGDIVDTNSSAAAKLDIKPETAACIRRLRLTRVIPPALRSVIERRCGRIMK